MSQVEVDLADDRFDVRYDPERVRPEQILELVRGLGYTPELVRAQPAPAAATHVDLAALPADVRALFERARAAQRLVLIDFAAPG